MAQKRTGRSGVISLCLAHHGQSLATVQISGNAFRIRDFKVDVPGSVKVSIPSSVLAGDTPFIEFAAELIKIADRNELIICGARYDRSTAIEMRLL